MGERRLASLFPGPFPWILHISRDKHVHSYTCSYPCDLPRPRYAIRGFGNNP
ncbi:hypothetical protein HOLleu_33181 [Holothuria leucospilota]|uniref:Uncharacterized protein n=1 Tax=Holothuria leucospilota TaxID=206669 RepID=A0A9Q0YPX1_HOLLE|nr:hypothetical protein HOLleu_33181 [Holothuria leucospilota]